MLSDHITKLLHQIAKNEGFSDYKFETKAGSNHGDNFLGVMISVTINGTTGKNGNSKSDKLHLICKVPPSNEDRKKNFRTDLVFDREIYAYSKLLPAFIRFQKEKGLCEADSFVSFPKVYFCDFNPENGTAILIMEDLRAKNFEMWPKEKVIPLDHELFVMRELAKFHAISFAMKDQRAEEFAEFKKLKDGFAELAFHGKLRSFMNRTVERAAEVLKNPKHKKMMENFSKTYVKSCENFLIGPASSEYGIIGHGDCWNNNFLFQHDESDKTKLKQICLLDWQLCRYCPPVLDLLYNIFASTDKEFRAKHYDKLLKTYHSTLCDSIRKLDSDPDKLYPYEKFEQQLRKMGDFALFFGPMIIQIKVAGAADIGNLDEYAEMVERGEEPDLINEYDEKTQMEYSRLINDLVTDLVDYGYVKCEA